MSAAAVVAGPGAGTALFSENNKDDIAFWSVQKTDAADVSPV